MVNENSKSFLTKDVDEENKQGFYLSYKSLIQKVADVILEINDKFPYPHSFANNLFEMANNHIYFAKHLPKLTDVSIKENDMEEVEKMLNYFINKLLAE